MYSIFRRIFTPALYVLIFFTGFQTAYWWFLPRNTPEQNLPVLTTLAALCAVWLAYALAAAFIRRRQRQDEHAMKLERENVRPLLYAEMRYNREAPEKLLFAVCNQGKGAANNIRLNIEPQADSPAAATLFAALQDLPLTKGMAQLAAGEDYAEMFGDIRTLLDGLNGQAFDGTLKVVFAYDNIFGEAQTSETVLDLALLNGLAAALQPKPRRTFNIF
ncbi:hypothetical protein ACOR62_10170 [Neisseria lisongii]|uniref:Uncharacterized protein n=1 Tax=Neisseria lisongii TaxID=2912188 RepID=A0AAW5AM10_9NEIS|nr:hypothetical protein [Neisseria lisongii]MCF7530546.1 hypothetical protein [Neisseria lisongii]